MSESLPKQANKSYIRTVAKRACQDIAGISWVAGLVGAVVAPLITLATGISNPDNVLETILIAVGGAAIAIIGEFIIRFISVIPQMHKEQLAEIAMLKLGQIPCLGIEGVPCSITTSERHPCQIRITSSKTADNVTVELLSLEDELGNAGKFLHPEFPIALRSETDGINTINPGSSQKYNFFQVAKSNSTKNKFISYFTEESIKDVALFRGNKLYRLKLAATARDLQKVESEFFLKFSCTAGEFCQFDLIPVSPDSEKKAKEFNRALILEALGEFRFALNQRAKQINKMPSEEYHKENIDRGDMKTSSIFSEIEAYFNSNPIDLGTNALADLKSNGKISYDPIHCIYGKTIYHDEWEGMQLLINRYEKNIGNIADKLNAKPL
jgi:hypothetical protein